MNEKDKVKQIIKNNEIDEKKPSKTIQLLIKYYYNQNINKDEIRKRIEEFMQKNYQGFNSTRWQNSLDTMVKRYANDKYKLININRVFVTQKELEKIKGINNIELERLAFVLLIYAKTYNQINENNNNWVKAKKTVILKDAKIKGKNKQSKYKLFTELNKIKLINFADTINNTSIQVNYIDNISRVEIEIEDLQSNFISQYLTWRKGYCIICGKELDTKSNRGKYCPTCAKEIHKQNKLKYWNKNKEKYR
jgi:hypothetical protein